MQFFVPGVALLVASIAFGLLSLWGYLSFHRGDEGARTFARRCYLLFVLAVSGASGVLLWKFLSSDFQIAYVTAYSSRDLPIHFKVSAFWAGQEGSFLLWLLCGAWLGVFLYREAREQEAPAMIVHVATQLMIAAILIKQSPFAYLPGGELPADGKGLNPLLQDFWMVFHPPVMFIGYAAVGIPFALAIAGLWTRRYDSWIVRSFPWAHVAFITLGLGILLGGYWAYKTLGWGGYWGWDPVENASLVPWLGVTALLHGLYAQKTKGRYRRLNFVLAIFSWGLILYGTFLTRSGVLADFSVHSFVDLGIGGWLLTFLLGTLAIAFALFFLRMKEIPSPSVQEPLLSRGVLVMLAIAVLVGAAAVVLLGTSAPLLTRFGDNPSQVSTSFYNVTNLPVALLVSLLVGLGPFLGWKGNRGGELLRRAVGPLLFAIAATALAWFLGFRGPGYVVILFASCFGFASSLLRSWQSIRDGRWREAGGVLSHAGATMMIAGIIVSSVHDRTDRIELTAGKPVTLDGRELTFLRAVPGSQGMTTMEVAVKNLSNGRVVTALPRFGRNSNSGQLFANPFIRNGPFADFYIAPQSYEPGEPGGATTGWTLARGETVEHRGFRLTFRGFEIAKGNMQDVAHMAIGVGLSVAGPGGVQNVDLLFRPAEKGGGDAARPMPGAPEGTLLRVTGIDAGSGRVRLELEGPPAFAANPGVPESLSVSVTIKPMIQLVWAGFYLAMIGSLIAFLLRRRESKALAVAGVGIIEPADVDRPVGQELASASPPAES
jgi:cytochrome c-type biogenesis protein CcmF